MLRRRLPRWRRRLGSNLSNDSKQELKHIRPFFMQPLVFLSGWVVLGLLFGLQEYVMESIWGYKTPLWVPLVGWTVEFALWGLAFLGMWRFLQASIQSASLRQMILQYLPLSILVGVVEEMLWAAIFRYQS